MGLQRSPSRKRQRPAPHDDDDDDDDDEDDDVVLVSSNVGKEGVVEVGEGSSSSSAVGVDVDCAGFVCTECGRVLSHLTYEGRVAHLKRCTAFEEVQVPAAGRVEVRRVRLDAAGRMAKHLEKKKPESILRFFKSDNLQAQKKRAGQAWKSVVGAWRNLLDGGGRQKQLEEDAKKKKKKQKRRKAANGEGAMGRSSRTPPSYKRIAYTSFIVDGFGFKADPAKPTAAFFLTHFHSDHYGGLTRRFRRGAIYCSEVTASLCIEHFKLPANDVVVSLPMNERVLVDSVGVTLVDANHCPGAVMFVFETPEPRKSVSLHVGDFRFHPKMRDDPVLKRIAGKVDFLYLDTTYCNPRYDFMSQEDAIAHVVETCSPFMDAPKASHGDSPVRQRQPVPGSLECFFGEQQDDEDDDDDGRSKTLVLVGTYSIGKERVLLRLAREYGVPIGVAPATKERWRMCNLVPSDEFDALFTSDLSKTNLLAVSMWELSHDSLAGFLKRRQKYLQRRYRAIVAFRPTGWALKPKSSRRGRVTIHQVPYSEHSSFPELQQFVSFIRPRTVIPTVNVAQSEAQIMHFTQYLRA